MRIYASSILLTLIAFGLFGCGANPNKMAVKPPEPPKEVQRITVEEVIAEMEKGREVIFLDTRAEMVWSQAKTKIPRAIRVKDSQDLRDIFRELPKDRFIVTYCT